MDRLGPPVWRVAGYILIAILIAGLVLLLFFDDSPIWFRALGGFLVLAQIVEGVIVLWRNRKSVLGE